MDGAVVHMEEYFFFQAEDGIRAAQESRGLGDVYKRQVSEQATFFIIEGLNISLYQLICAACSCHSQGFQYCLLYTSDAADDLLCVDLGGRRIIKKKTDILL